MNVARRPSARALLPCLLVLWLGLALFDSVRQSSVTVDEFAHLPAGLSYWHSGAFWIYRHNPPLLRLLVAAPLAAAGIEAPPLEGVAHRWQLGARFMRAQGERYHAVYMRARGVVILLSCLTALLLYCTTRRALGYGPALVALTLFCFSPTVLAHGGLVTTDAGFCLAFLAVCVVGAGFLRDPSWKRSLGLGLLLGVAQLVKFTALLLYPILLLVPAALPWLARRFSPEGGFGWLALPPGGRARRLAAVVLLSLLVLNAGYLFEGTGLPLAVYPFQHPLLRLLAGSPLGVLPCPLPADFLLGFDAQYWEASGKFTVYLLGETTTEGWWYYYPLALLFKVPLPLFLMLAALVAGLLGRRLALTPLLVGCLAVPGLALAFFSFLTNIDIGVRYLLFLFPLVYIAVAHLARPPLSGRRGVLVVACLLGYAASSAATHPHYLSYFSEICGRAGRGHLYLADSNLDWGQDLIRLKRFMEERRIPSIALSHFGLVDPAVYGISYEPLASSSRSDTVVISINHLLGIHPWGRPRSVASYRGREPTARVGYSLWVFDRDAAVEGPPGSPRLPRAPEASFGGDRSSRKASVLPGMSARPGVGAPG